MGDCKIVRCEMFVRCKMPVRCALLEEEQDVGQNGNDKNLNCIFSMEGKNSHMMISKFNLIWPVATIFGEFCPLGI